MTAGSAACAWAIAFAAVHVYWLAGGTAGLPPDIAAERPAAIMLAALLAVPLLVGAGAVALVAPRLQSTPARWAAMVALGLVASFGLVHALPPLVTAVVHWFDGTFAVGPRDTYALLLYEPNWLIGGTLFARTLRNLVKRKHAA